MISPSLEQELHELLKHLALEQQRQVVEFARALAATRVHGVPGYTLLRFADSIEADDLACGSLGLRTLCAKPSTLRVRHAPVLPMTAQWLPSAPNSARKSFWRLGQRDMPRRGSKP